MRIVCQKCATAYVIDDRLVTPGGVRAQCPRCRHLQRVAGPEPEEPSSPERAEPAQADPRGSSDSEAIEAPPDPPAEEELDPRRPRGSEGSGFEDTARSPPRRARPTGSAATLRARPPRRAFRGFSISRRTLALAGAGLLGMGGLVLLILRPWVDHSPPLAAPVAVVTPMDRVAARWKASYPRISGTASEHVETGFAQLALDTPAGLANARVEFQQALILEPRKERAVGGYVRALVLSEGADLTDEQYQEALGLVAGVEARTGGSPEVWLAHAELLLTRPERSNLADARSLAERAIAQGNPSEQAVGYLVLGQSHLGSNVIWAAENLDKALALQPKLERARFVRARAFAAAGQYRKAITQLEKRLSAVPDHWDVADALARMYLEVGEAETARRVYEKVAAAAASSDIRPRLALAVLAYQHLGRPEQAVEALEALARDREHSQSRLPVIRVHLAAAQRRLGNLDAAARAARQALEVRPEDAGAHLQLFLVALARGKADEARGHFSQIERRLGDAGLEKLLEGKLLLEEGKLPEAIEAFAKAHELDERRTDALLWAGSVAARARLESQAYQFVLQHALSADPLQSGPRPILTRSFVGLEELLRGAEGHFGALSTGRLDPNPHLCEGLIRWHLGELAGADQRFQRALAIDGANAAALSFRSLIALRRGRVGEALRHGARAADAGRQMALARFAYAKALLAAKKDDAAKKEAYEALTWGPRLLGAQVVLGELAFKDKQVEEAERRLMTVVGIDGTRWDAKRVLYLYGE